MAADPAPVTPRGESTRQRIVDAALRLFEERGYERTTMRAVAAEAGVSLGNAYYYFASKEHLVQGFYERLQDLHRAAAERAIAALPPGRPDATSRLLAVEHAFLDVAAPYHEFGAAFFSAAADPRSPLSPFSPQSAPARRSATALYAAAVEGSDLTVDALLRDRLPELLWLAHLGVTLRWVHDLSDDRRATRAFVDRAVPAGVRLLRLTRFRPARPIVRDLLGLLDARGV